MIHQLHLPNATTGNTYYGIQYTFSDIGAGLPTHHHDVDTGHTTQVMSGSILFTQNNTPVTVNTGTTHVFDWSVDHKIDILEANTTIISWLVNGMPQGYDKLPPEELEWTRDVL